MKPISKDSWLYKFNLYFGKQSHLENCKTVRKFIALSVYNGLISVGSLCLASYFLFSAGIEAIKDPLAIVQALGIILVFLSILALGVLIFNYIKKLLSGGNNIDFE